MISLVILAGLFYPPVIHSLPFNFNSLCSKAFVNTTPDLLNELQSKNKEEIQKIFKTRRDVNYSDLLKQLVNKKEVFQNQEKNIIRAVGDIKPEALLAELTKFLKESKELSDQDKLFIAQVIVENLQNQLQNSQSNKRVASLKPREIGQIYEVLSDRMISYFSTTNWHQENKHNRPLQKKVKETKDKIYTLFEEYPQYIPPKTLRKFAERVTQPNYTEKEKIAYIRILKKFSQEKTLKDTLTIQRLGEGLNDFDPEVRREAVEALGQILSKKIGTFEYNALLNILTQKPLNFYWPFLFAYMLTPKDWNSAVSALFALTAAIGWVWHSNFSHPSQHEIRWHISEQLHKAMYDPNSKVRESAIHSISQMKVIYPFLIDDLIEAIAFSSDDKVKKQALNRLEASFEKISLDKWYFLLRSLYTERVNNLNPIIESLYRDYDKTHEYRHIVLDFLLKKEKIEPKKPEKYYSVQDQKASDLTMEITKYKKKNIKTLRKGSNNNEPPPFDSWFEVEVFLQLHKKGYIVLPQFPVQQVNNSSSFYYIDLVVLDSKDPQKKLAIECDGPGHEGKEEQDYIRQNELEKQGWTIWRIKHSKKETPSLSSPPFYFDFSDWKKSEINPETLDKLWEELDKRGIKPVGNNPDSADFMDWAKGA